MIAASTPSATTEPLFQLISDARSGALTEADAKNRLAAITGWPTDNIDPFASALALNYPADDLDPRTYDRLRLLSAMAGQTRASGTQLVRWAGAPSGEADAKSFGDEALGVLKSHYSDPDWLTFAPRSWIRCAKTEEALQAFLIAKRDAATGEPLTATSTASSTTSLSIPR